MKNSYLKKLMVLALTAVMTLSENPTAILAESQDFAENENIEENQSEEQRPAEDVTAELEFGSGDNLDNGETNSQGNLIEGEAEEVFESEEMFSEDPMNPGSAEEEKEEFAFSDGEENEDIMAVQSSGTGQIIEECMKIELQEGENTISFVPPADGFYEITPVINEDSLEENIEDIADFELVIDGNKIDEEKNYSTGEVKYPEYYLRSGKKYTITATCEYWDEKANEESAEEKPELSLAVNLKAAKTYPADVIWGRGEKCLDGKGKDGAWELFFTLNTSGTLTIERGYKEASVLDNGECGIERLDFKSLDGTSVKKIILKEGITIFSVPLNTMKNLTEIQIPASLKRFGDPIYFKDCKKLEKITIPEKNSLVFASNMPNTLYVKNYQNDSVRIGNVLICYKGKEKEWKVSNDVITIGKIAVLDNKTLKKVTIPGSVTSIQYAAFAGDTALESAILEDGVKEIGYQAFLTTPSLKEITIPKSVTKMDTAALGWKVTENGYEQNETLPTINCYAGSAAYEYAKENNLPYRLIDETPASLVGKTFTSGNYKYKITGENTVTLTGLKKQKTSTVKIGNTVKYKGKAYSITAIGNKALYNNKYVTKVTIGNKVKTIGASSFANCKKLKSITIGSSVATIGGSAMKGDSKLTSIVIKSTKLKTVKSNVFKGISKNARIKVPSSKLKSYKKLLKNKGQSNKVKITK